MRISEMMSVNLVTCEADTTVTDACRRMAKANVGSVLACTDGELVGILTERDVLKLIAERKQPDRELVRDHMTARVIGAPPDAPAADVADLMNQHRVRHLAILDGGTPVGIVSMRDFFVMSGAILRARGADAAGELLRAATV
jgi:CBS domain-containing protein